MMRRSRLPDYQGAPVLPHIPGTPDNPWMTAGPTDDLGTLPPLTPAQPGAVVPLSPAGGGTPGGYCFGLERAVCQSLRSAPVIGTFGPEVCEFAAQGLCVIVAAVLFLLLLGVSLAALLGSA